MNANIADCALRLAGLATRAFGWSPDQFWQVTPAELAAALITDETAAVATLSRIELDALMERESHD